MTTPEITAQSLTFNAVTDARTPFFFQIPAVALHRGVLAALDMPELSLAILRRVSPNQIQTVWLVADDGESWDGCPTPWHTTVRLSNAVWRAFGPGTAPSSGEHIQLSCVIGRMPTMPAHIEAVLPGNEVGLHRADAAKLGIGRWALLNHNGIPAACRVRSLEEDRDRGVVRLSYQGRLLLGVPDAPVGLSREITVAPLPADSRGRPLLVSQPRWAGTRHPRWARAMRAMGAQGEHLMAGLLRAPGVAFRTVEASPGEDQMLTVRIPAALFPLLGTQPGRQVYVEWGPGNRAIATALMAHEPTDGDWPSVHAIGRRPSSVVAAPSVAQLSVGVNTRAALGIPRVTVVTVRRRVTPLIVNKLNELIFPSTGLFIALAVDARLRAWTLVLAIMIILGLLLLPLRIRRNPQGRVR